MATPCEPWCGWSKSYWMAAFSFARQAYFPSASAAFLRWRMAAACFPRGKVAGIAAVRLDKFSSCRTSRRRPNCFHPRVRKFHHMLCKGMTEFPILNNVIVVAVDIVIWEKTNSRWRKEPYPVLLLFFLINRMLFTRRCPTNAKFVFEHWAIQDLCWQVSLNERNIRYS